MQYPASTYLKLASTGRNVAMGAGLAGLAGAGAYGAHRAGLFDSTPGTPVDYSTRTTLGPSAVPDPGRSFASPDAGLTNLRTYQPEPHLHPLEIPSSGTPFEDPNNPSDPFAHYGVLPNRAQTTEASTSILSPSAPVADLPELAQNTTFTHNLKPPALDSSDALAQRPPIDLGPEDSAVMPMFAQGTLGAFSPVSSWGDPGMFQHALRAQTAKNIANIPEEPGPGVLETVGDKIKNLGEQWLNMYGE